MSLKSRTAGAVKWNLVDRLSSQLLYAVTGVVLARLLTPADFGLVGAVLVFQAFASLVVDSGFAYALVQRKAPSRLDYSTVMWFNLGAATVAYVVLFLGAPLIAWCFGGDQRLIPLSRVMLLGLILNASGAVHLQHLVKQMRVSLIAAANAVSLFAGAVVGILLALRGYGAWAIVWQGLTLAAVKSMALWWLSDFRPLLQFSFKALRSFFAVGSAVMLSSTLNTIFQNIYSFFIGNRAGLSSLGYYTQADKWSKMGIASLSQVMTSSFLPTLSEVQDDPERLQRATRKMNRLAAYLLFPAMGFLAVMATPVFHCLFGTKWDLAIVLFQILLARGIFTVLAALYSHYLMAVARSRQVVAMEGLRDGLALALLVVCLPWIAVAHGADTVWGVRLLLWGQLIASAIGCAVTLCYAAPAMGCSRRQFLADLLPYLGQTLPIMAILWLESLLPLGSWTLLGLQALSALSLYILSNLLLGSALQRELLQFLKGSKSL